MKILMDAWPTQEWRANFCLQGSAEQPDSHISLPGLVFDGLRRHL